MAIYVYCERPSDSARELVTALEGIRLRRFDGMHFWRKNKRVTLKKDDIVICWGDDFPGEVEEGIRVLNGAEVGNKYKAAAKIMEAGVPTITIRKDDEIRGTYNQKVQSGWLPRSNNHVGGSDLLNFGPANYWAAKEELTEEYRIHSFLGKSIRAGVKRLREGYSLEGANGTLKAHDWVRSFDGGWRIVYDAFQSNAKMRNIAHKAVKALDLSFGAVDVGLRRDGTYMVLEVNRAPGLEGGSITAYINAIKKWIEEGDKADVVDISGNEGRAEDGAVAKAANAPAAERERAEAAIERRPEPERRERLPFTEAAFRRILDGTATPEDSQLYNQYLRELNARIVNRVRPRNRAA